MNTLYLALDVGTAVREYQQVSPLLPPGTLVSYCVSAMPVVDFTRGYAPGTWDPLWEDFYCDWRTIWFNERTEPPSWVLGDAVIAAGAKGILFRSRLSPAGINLALYVDELDANDRLDVHDPSGSLPHNQSSWAPRPGTSKTQASQFVE